MAINLPFNLPGNPPFLALPNPTSQTVRIPPGKVLYVALDCAIDVNTHLGVGSDETSVVLLSQDGTTPDGSPVVLSAPLGRTLMWLGPYWVERLARIEVRSGSASYCFSVDEQVYPLIAR